MDLRAPSYLPFKRRDAYQPGDPGAYLMLQQMRCVLPHDAVSDPLCSACKEVLLGEPLLDVDDNETEYRIALYALPCGHLRCCACALAYLDTAGLFYQICQCCDSKKTNVKPDLSEILDSIGYGAESALPGFDEIKSPKSTIHTKYSLIRLPTIQEVDYEHVPETPSRLGLSALKLQTPAAKRVTLDLDSPTHHTNPAKRRKVDRQDQEEPSQISSFQWTPIAQRVHKNYSPFTLEVIPETLDTPAVIEAREAKLRCWAMKSKDLLDDGEGEDESSIPSYDEFVEVQEEQEEEAEEKSRKKPRLDTESMN
ncbi:MAG: hypothetical protein Q9184_000089 [Pyrenodesmia sp. 2 TL-2023]